MNRSRLLAACLAFFAVAFFVAVPLFAQVDADPGTYTVDDSQELTSTQFWDQLGNVITQFKTVGVFAGLVALINLLLTLLRIPPLNAWLEKKGWKAYKVYAAAVLGGLGAMFGAVAMGRPWWPDAIVAFITGVLAGLTAVGTNTMINAKKDSELKAAGRAAGGS